MIGTWRMERGARIVEGGVHLEVWAPGASEVEVVVESGAASGVHRLRAGAAGVHAGMVPEMAAGDRYRFRLDGEPAPIPDPVSRSQPDGVHGASQVVDPTAFRWTDAAWRGRPTADLVIYELHVGTFTEAGTFDAAIERLPDLVALGVTAIELMPIAQFPGERNWGYDGACLYAPQESYGGPEGLRRLVDAAHAAGLAVVLDVVYNHVGPEGNYLGRFGPYFTRRYGTPWGMAVNYDGPGSDEVRRFAIDNARYWISEFHIDGLRLDAIHAIFDFSAYHVLQELADAVHAVAAEAGRSVSVIAESDLNDPRVVRTVERCGWGLDAQWSDDFHHAVHVALTGERSGYYADFGGLGPIALALRERFVYGGVASRYRGRRHGAPAGDVPADRFVVFIQNHDQVGNRATGERLSELLDGASQRLGAALLLLGPYVPLLFMGEEYGETNPFLYFVSHGDPDLAEQVRWGRREEFRAFGWPGEIPDPQAESTFARSRLDWSRRERPPHAGMLALYTDLLALRRREPALRPGDGEYTVHVDDSAGWLALHYTRPGNPLLALFNFMPGDPAGSVSVSIPVPGRWELVLTTDDSCYGGQGLAGSDGIVCTFPGRGAALFREAGA